jgi:two-component system sensor histidine kinase KdpD
MRTRASDALLAAAAVAVATALVAALRPAAPTLSLGAVYTLAVIAVAVVSGVAWAVAAAVASMLVFNFAFLPPVGTLTLADGRNWTALGVYVACAIVAGDLAGRARRRAHEAERRERETAFLADVAAELLYDAGPARLDELRARAQEAVGADAGPHLESALAALVATAEERQRLEEAAREAEALRRSDAIKTTILRSVSHDFRTPLATMQASLDGLSDRAPEPGERDELIASLRTELRRLTRLVTNLLDLSRLQAGAAAPHRRLWSPDELVAGALDAVDDPRVRVAVPPGLPPVEVDAVQLQRALSNLVENALKFSPAGEPVVLRASADDAEVAIEVEDRGAGISPETVESLFEPFARGDGGGAGLGLAIARGFAAANGARLELRPGADGGTCAAVVLPTAPVPAAVA